MNKFLLIVLIVTAVILRFYKGPELFFWHVDEDIIGLTVKRILVDHRLQLLGFPIPGGVYLGPLFYYLISIPYALSLMNPTMLPLFSALLGTISIFLVYKVGKTIFENERVGLLAAMIYGFSYLINIYSRVLTGLSFAGILALLTYLFLYQNLKFKKPVNLLFLGIILLISIQNEGSSLSLLALTVVVWLIYRFKIPAEKLFQILLLFLIFHLPLLIFDLRHNFFISKAFLNFFSRVSPGSMVPYNFSTVVGVLEAIPKTFARILFISGPNDIGKQILPCSNLVDIRNSISPAIYGLVILIIGFFVISHFFSKKIVIGQKIILLHFLILFLGLGLYNLFMRGYVYEWTLAIFFPGISLIIAYFLNELYKNRLLGRTLVVIFLMSFVLINVRSILASSNKFGLGSKVMAVKSAINEVAGRQFYLDSIGSCYSQGYIYLFWYLGHSPSISYADLMFGTGLIQPKSSSKPNLGIVMVNPSENESREFFDKYNFYKAKTVKTLNLNEIEVLVVEEK